MSKTYIFSCYNVKIVHTCSDLYFYTKIVEKNRKYANTVIREMGLSILLAFSSNSKLHKIVNKLIKINKIIHHNNIMLILKVIKRFKAHAVSK